MKKNDGRFKKGEHRSPSTEFKPGEHWREPKPFWNRDWLYHEYIELGRSSQEIADQFDCNQNNILYFLDKFDIPRRTISETRSIKHWGQSGKDNPMYGKKGILNPNWKGGLTPFRQYIYTTQDWKKFSKAVRTRDKVCRLCGGSEKLEIHHIDPVSQSPLLIMDIGNAILLCAKCHRKMLGKEKRWKKQLLSLIGKGG